MEAQVWEEDERSMMRETFLVDERRTRLRSIIDQTEQRRTLVPKIEVAPLEKNLEALAERAGIKDLGFHQYFENHLQGIQEELLADKYGSRIKNSEQRFWPVLEILYNYYLHPESPKKGLRSFDDFVAHFFPQADFKLQSFLQLEIGYFIEERLNPYRRIEIKPGFNEFEATWNPPEKISAYQFQGEWVLLPCDSQKQFTLVAPSVLDEVIALLESEYKNPAWIHGSGSAALESIGNSGALLSAYKVKEKGAKVHSGSQTIEVPNREKFTGLGAVYVFEIREYTTFSPYVPPNWFNEFDLSFGINSQKQYAHLEKIGERRKAFLSGPDPECGGSAYKIGSEVPLACIETVYCPKIYQPKVQLWAQKYAPHIQVISQEAAQTLNSYKNFINQATDWKKERPLDVWKSLNRNPIIVGVSPSPRGEEIVADIRKRSHKVGEMCPLPVPA